MRSAISITLSAGLGVLLTLPALAQQTPAGAPPTQRQGEIGSPSGQSPQTQGYDPSRAYGSAAQHGGAMGSRASAGGLRDYTIRSQWGTAAYGFGGEPAHTISSLSRSDQRVLHDLYGRHMLHAATLAQHQEQLRAANDLDNSGLAGRMMVQHLILASRARQFFHDTGTPLVEVDLALNDFRVSPGDWSGGMVAGWRGQLEEMNREYARIENAQLRDLAAGSRTGYETHIALLEGRNITVAGGTPSGTPAGTPAGERVAGEREATDDADILAMFYTSQVEERNSLRVQAEHLRSVNNAALVDMFLKMADDHNRLAEQAAGLIRERGGTVPEVPEHPRIEGSPAQLVRHMRHHHQSALKRLNFFSRQAGSAAVRQLLQTAMQGTQEHLRMLEQHGEAR